MSGRRVPRLRVLLLVMFCGAASRADDSNPLEAETFEEVAVAGEWLDTRWEFRKKLTVAGANLGEREVHDDVSLLLRLNADFDQLFLGAKPDGSDVEITTGDGITKLSREIVSWNQSERSAEIWFRAPRLSRTVREFYVYYGNPDTTLVQHDRGAWNDSYLGVYHFEEDPGSGILLDHGPQGNDAFAGLNSAFTSEDTIRGAVGRAWRFNGSTHWIDGDAIQSSDSSFTIGAWFASWNQENEADFAFSVGTGFWHLSAKRNGQQKRPDFAYSGGFFTWPPSTLPDTLLHHMVWAMDGVADTIRFYFDGEEQDVLLRGGGPRRVYTGLQIGGNVGIASPLFGNTNPFDLMEGIVDEFRVQAAVLSPQRVKLEYSNMSNPAEFFVVGPEETEATPITLLDLRGERYPEHVVLRWLVAESSEAIQYFEVYRGSLSHPWELASLQPLPGGEREYSFLDGRVSKDADAYWIAATLADGSIAWNGPVLVPARLELERDGFVQSRPNPFRESTTIRFHLLDTQSYALRIFDARGRSVRRPLTGRGGPGERTIVWDGRDEAGNLVPSGVYYYRLAVGAKTYTRKLLINR